MSSADSWWKLVASVLGVEKEMRLPILQQISGALGGRRRSVAGGERASGGGGGARV